MVRKLLIPIALAGTLTSAPALAERSRSEETNIANAKAFYEAAINEKDFEKARAYMGDKYIQHNPIAPDGIEGFKGFLDYLKKNSPGRLADIKAAFADGDYVILHVHGLGSGGSRGNAVIDIFRFDTNGKIIEHWDVIQPIPEKAANSNTMF